MDVSIDNLSSDCATFRSSDEVIPSLCKHELFVATDRLDFTYLTLTLTAATLAVHHAHSFSFR